MMPGIVFQRPWAAAFFDNADCTTRQPVVDRQVSEQISIIQRLERNPPFQSSGNRSCRIDTSQQNLDHVAYIDLRRRVTFQPATDGTTGGCIGYIGPSFLVYAAPNVNANILGVVEQGFTFSRSHLPWRQWNFAIVWRDATTEDPVTIGWYREEIGQNCGLSAR